jgi:hypothetical protein
MSPVLHTYRVPTPARSSVHEVVKKTQSRSFTHPMVAPRQGRVRPLLGVDEVRTARRRVLFAGMSLLTAALLALVAHSVSAPFSRTPAWLTAPFHPPEPASVTASAPQVRSKPARWLLPRLRGRRTTGHDADTRHVRTRTQHKRVVSLELTSGGEGSFPRLTLVAADDPATSVTRAVATVECVPQDCGAVRMCACHGFEQR